MKKKEFVPLKALLDSGASSSLITEDAVRHLKKTPCALTSYATVAGQFSTNEKCQTILKMPEFNSTAEINYKLNVSKTLGQYDIILGRDYLHELGIDINLVLRLCIGKVRILI